MMAMQFKVRQADIVTQQQRGVRVGSSLDLRLARARNEP